MFNNFYSVVLSKLYFFSSTAKHYKIISKRERVNKCGLSRDRVFFYFWLNSKRRGLDINFKSAVKNTLFSRQLFSLVSFSSLPQTETVEHKRSGRGVNKRCCSEGTIEIFGVLKSTGKMDDGQRIGKWEVAGFVVGCVGIVLSGYSLYLWDHDEVKITGEIVQFGEWLSWNTSEMAF